MRLALHGSVTVRKEWFGCLVCDARTRDFHQFNTDAFEILRHLRVPGGVSDVCARLAEVGLHASTEDVAALVADLDNHDLTDRDGSSPQATFFYEHARIEKVGRLIAPSSVTLYVTDYCPKQCTHCVTRSSPYVDRSGELCSAEWISVMERLRAFGVLALVITGGDPLAKKGIFDMLHAADALGFGVSLLTDFDGMSAEHVSEFKTMRHLADVQVSLDGGTAETHDRIRGRGAFSKALRRMRLLGDSGIPYTISTTVSKRNIGELEHVVRIYRECGARYLYINPLAPYGRAAEQMIPDLLDDGELRWLGSEYARLTRAGLIDPGNPYWYSDDAAQADFHPFKDALTAVSIGVYNLSFGSRGDCYLDSKMKAADMLHLGNVMTHDLEAMWNDPRLEELRSHFSPNAFTFVDHSVAQAIDTYTPRSVHAAVSHA